MNMKKSILSTCSPTITSSNFLFRSDFIFIYFFVPFALSTFFAATAIAAVDATSTLLVLSNPIWIHHVGTVSVLWSFGMWRHRKNSRLWVRFINNNNNNTCANVVFSNFPFFFFPFQKISLSKIELPHIRFFVIDKSGNSFFSYIECVFIVRTFGVLGFFCLFVCCFVCRLQQRSID